MGWAWVCLGASCGDISASCVDDNELGCPAWRANHFGSSCRDQPTGESILDDWFKLIVASGVSQGSPKLSKYGSGGTARVNGLVSNLLELGICCSGHHRL